MPHRVLKFPLNFEPIQQVRLPARAQILSFTGVNHWPTLYVLVEDDQPTIERTLYLYATGEATEHDLNTSTFLGTVVFAPRPSADEAADVWHAFIENAPMRAPR